MSQSLTYEAALTLKRGDILFHNILEFGLVEGEKDPATCTVAGRVRKVPGPEQFELPVVRNYGDHARTLLTRMSRDLWRTTPEKVVPTRLRRARDVPTQALPEEHPAEADKPPVKRVSRVRSSPTGRIVDEEAEGQRIINTALDQLHSLNLMGTRTGRTSSAEGNMAESNVPKSGSRVRRTR